jgi:hypothetical protein
MPHRALLRLRLVAALATAGVVACGKDAAPTTPDPGSDPSTPMLTVGLGAGVLGTPSSNTPFPRGYTVSYSYNPQPGYQDLRVTLDGSPIAAAGTFKMDGPHTLVATATRVAAAASATAR